jgi:DNA-binding MarR family transcriptional regulator
MRSSCDIVSSVNDSSVSTAGLLLEATGLLRRTIRRALRQISQTEPLPPTHCELLRLAESRPGITVADAAQELHLAPNTVSTLVGKLTSDGLLSRSRSATDGRTAQLAITAAARKRLAERRDLRAEVAARALARLSPADRQAIAAAVPALLRLGEEIQSLERAA